MRTIFCPSNHLILDQNTCPVCHWQRPPRGDFGLRLWEPIFFEPGLGGPSPDHFALPAVSQGIIIFPLRNGELAGVTLATGRMAWRQPPAENGYPRSLYEDGCKVLAVVSDFRDALNAENAFLVQIEPTGGILTRLWEGSGFTMTDPVLYENLIILRTARGRIAALRRDNPAELLWSVPVKTYKPTPPIVCRERLLVWDGEVSKEQVQLKALSLKDGKTIWQVPRQDTDANPVTSGDLLIYRAGKRSILCVNTNQGELVWQQKFDRVYGAPQMVGDTLYLVVRGSNDESVPERYCLAKINPQNGEVLYRQPIGVRAQEIVELPDGRLLLGGGDTKIAVCSPDNGEIQWQHSFGDEKWHRVQTHLKLSNGILLVGTYEGYAQALQMSTAQEENPDPQAMLDCGNWEEAAIGFALAGKYKKAAEIYLEKIKDAQKALALFEHARDLRGQSNALLELGDELSAARKLEEGKYYEDAAALYEKAEQPRDALELYRKVGRKEDVKRLLAFVPRELSDIEELEAENRLVEAGEGAMQIEDWRRAVDLFHRANETAREMEALKQITTQNPEPWSLEHLAEVARSLGHFEEEAFALEKLGIMDKAAEAYRKAAKQTAHRAPGESARIGDLYDKAQNLFGKYGMIPEQRECWQQMITFRRWPWVSVTGQTRTGFKQGEFNLMDLKISNVGSGVAREIFIQVAAGDFLVDETTTTVSISALAPGRSVEDRRLVLQSKGDKIGVLTLMLEWFWKDLDGKQLSESNIEYVSVKSRDDSHPSSSPVIINAKTYVAGGYTEVKGDQVEQKGDKVEINRYGSARPGVQVSSGETASSKMMLCPVCSMEIPAGSDFCTECGNPIKRASRARSKSSDKPVNPVRPREDTKE